MVSVRNLRVHLLFPQPPTRQPPKILANLAQLKYGGRQQTRSSRGPPRQKKNQIQQRGPPRAHVTIASRRAR
ncbi:hypothetical protein B0T16DRAFT_407981 [Cercophora newfieldiana]|uniref:Uncharacterized protein n=1 Tax=Cercophora newfieldiana TaxID=92897 RepID=A0AA40CTA0_9PEZI|nr:hypothetical protein B0T16DRAFT_407981 [Cercophora newfieldiana]